MLLRLRQGLRLRGVLLLNSLVLTGDVRQLLRALVQLVLDLRIRTLLLRAVGIVLLLEGVPLRGKSLDLVVQLRDLRRLLRGDALLRRQLRGDVRQLSFQLGNLCIAFCNTLLVFRHLALVLRGLLLQCRNLGLRFALVRRVLVAQRRQIRL